jgi:hypothetical protein
MQRAKIAQMGERYKIDIKAREERRATCSDFD